MSALEFKFRGLPAGYFEGPAYPTKEGRYHYMPYRSLGHYEMGLALKEKNIAEIEFDDSGTLRKAKAKKGEYGVLELSAFTP
jgi:hypothetical protein